MTVVAIHQPNFFPWLGYFNKIARADAFIFLDDVQFQKTGGMWSNRVKLLVSGEGRWITAPVDRRYSGVRNIDQMSFLPEDPWRVKFRKTLELNYRKHQFYRETVGVLDGLIDYPEENVAEYNVNAIMALVALLGLDAAKFHRSSALEGVGHSTELLCSLTHAVNGTSYMCGGGADGYQDEAVFARSKITLVHQNFIPKPYPQMNSGNAFVAGLSVIDALMNIGVDGVRRRMAADRE